MGFIDTLGLRLVLVAVMAVALFVCVLPTAAGESPSAESALIAATGVVVTAVSGDAVFVQEPDRSAGVRVTKSGHGLRVGDKVNVIGSPKSDASGERYIEASTVQVTEQNVLIRPLGMTNNSMGGWSWRPVEIEPDVWILMWKPYEGLSVVGLLMRTWGRVTHIAPDGSCLYIDDGSHLQDYAKTHVGVKVRDHGAAAVFAAYHTGDYLCLTGVCGSYPDPTTGDRLACLYVVATSDIQVIP